MKALLVCGIAGLAVLAGCGESGGSPKAERPSVAPSVSPSPTVDPYAPNIGERALAVGQSRVGRDVTTTLHEVRDPYPPQRYLEPGDGMKYVGLRLSTCVRKEAEPDTNGEGSYITPYNAEFALVDAKGDRYPGSGSNFNGWPTPKFPEARNAVPGECSKGWLVVEAPAKVVPEFIEWTSGQNHLADWKLR